MYPKAIYLIDLLMEVDELIVGKAQIKYKSPKRILNSIQKMIELVGGTLSQRQHNLNRGFVVAKKNIVVSVWDISTIYNDTNNNSNNTNKEIFIFGGYWNSSSYANISTQKITNPQTQEIRKIRKITMMRVSKALLISLGRSFRNTNIPTCHLSTIKTVAYLWTIRI